jgi:excisionase family DNA binding protein
MPETFITPNQLAKTLGIKPDKILAWIHAGQLVAVNVAANANGQRPRWRIDPDEVTRFLKSRQNKQAGETKAIRRHRKSKPSRQWV